MIKYRRVKGTLNSTEIISAYQKAFNMSWWKVLFSFFFKVFQLADQYYEEADENTIKLTLYHDETDLQKYIAEDFDCDDFAFRLMGVFHQDDSTAAMPIFITWVNTPQGGHAVLSYYYKGNVKFIEPQTDEIFAVPPTWELMLLCG